MNKHILAWGHTGLMVRASDSGSGDPGSILGRVGVFVSLSKRHLPPPPQKKKVLVIPRNRWLRLKMTEKLFTGTLNKNQKKKKKYFSLHFWNCQLLNQDITVPQKMAVAENQNHYFRFWGKKITILMHLSVNFSLN